MRDIAAHFGFQFLVAETENLSIILLIIKRFGAISKLLAVSYLQIGHQFTEVSDCVPGIDIEYLFTINVGILPFAVLQEKKNSFQKRSYICIAPGADRFLNCLLRFVRFSDLLYAADQILHEAEPGHVLRLQMGKLFRQIVRIHITVGRNQDFLPVALFDQRQKTAPLVLDPDSIEILRFGPKYYHDLRGIERSKDVWLVCSPELILQRDTGKEDLEAFLYKLVIQIVGKDAVPSSSSVIVRFLVADEDVERFLFLRYGKDPLLDIVDRFRFFLIQLPLISVRVLKR